MSSQTAGSKVAVVLGARGGTGQQIVRHLSERTGGPFREILAVVRDASAIDTSSLCFSPKNDDRIKIISGDVTRAEETLRSIFEGATHIFNATSGSASKSADIVAAVDRDAVGDTASLARDVCGSDLERYVLISSQMVHPSNKWSPIRIMLNNLTTGPFASQGLMDLKWEGEEKLRHLDPPVPYTIVRPGRLTDGEPLGGDAVAVGQMNGSFESGAVTTRADLAAVCVSAALAEGTKNTTFELSSPNGKKSDENGSGDGKKDRVNPIPDDLFSGLKPRYLEEDGNGEK